MKTLYLVSGEPVLVSDEDFDDLSQFRWKALRLANGLTYARRMWREGGKGSKQREERMHRRIMRAQSGEEIDHVNLNGLDNQRENLRRATRSENVCNRRTPNTNTSGVKGVYWHKAAKKWMASVSHLGVAYYLGLYETIAAAEAVVVSARAKLHGDFTRHNHLILNRNTAHGTCSSEYVQFDPSST